eukprot:TRINITY_DN1482_c0_g1_i1.p1 TRINITY_DN1482_c0_g1~~TRINITY_DN1482_c0_g1_i1.p1  ORF type:complete len:300 (+),score=93.33 TRINITY_DN1482_c0_g1_i1:179-1078(+)
MIEEINSKNAGWTAGFNDFFLGETADDIKAYLGTITSDPNSMQAYTRRQSDQDLSNVQVPDSFDSRQRWPACPQIADPLDQGKCGSCWAFGATKSISSRFCIATNNATNVFLSEFNMVTCDNGNNGCNGGQLKAAWDYVKENGLPTTKCQPYSIPTCSNEPCLPPFVNTPGCNGDKCADGSQGQKYYVDSVYHVGSIFGSNVEKIQQEILTNGPVEAAFTVYSDFIHYKSGVYRHTTGGVLGGHAIMIVGWGVENNTPYWIVSNSWTTNWGDKGFFKILRGSDECGIERDVVAGLVKTN